MRACLRRQRQICDQTALTRRIGDRKHRDLAHVRMLSEHRFDLAWLDPVAVNLHLPVDPLDEVDVAVSQQSRAVAGAVQTRSGC
jgi:hypothetical protein